MPPLTGLDCHPGAPYYKYFAPTGLGTVTVRVKQTRDLDTSEEFKTFAVVMDTLFRERSRNTPP